LGQGQPAGQAIGDPTNDLIRRKAYQDAAAKASQDRENVIEQLRKGQGLGPAEDNNTFDSITQDGSGNVTAKMNYQAPAYKIPGAQESLEGIEGIKAPTLQPQANRRSDIDYSPFF